MRQLFELVDPYYYRHRLNMPKFIVNASGDQFFPPDSSQFYFAELRGEKHLRYVPNANHSLDGTDALESVIAYYSLILAGQKAPRFTWTNSRDGLLQVTAVDQPKEVRLWQATNPEARDFRLETLGPQFESQLLEDQGNGRCVAHVAAPTKGWTAYFAELTYEVLGNFPIKLTSGVGVVPDRLPATTFPPDNTNAGGHHGNLDVNLGAIRGESDVRIRFRHYEQTDDEFIAIDNVVVDDVSPPISGPVQVFFEDFNSLTLGQMGVYEFVHLGAFFGTDSGVGGVSGFSWGTEDRPSPGRPDGRYQAGAFDEKNVNHLGHPTAEDPNTHHVPFAIIDSEAEEDGVDPPDNFQSERLHTPILDLTGLDTVILEWDEEVIYQGNPAFGSVASVVLMQDNGNLVPDPNDTIINGPDKFADIFAPYLPYDQFAGGAFASGDDPASATVLISVGSGAGVVRDRVMCSSEPSHPGPLVMS